MHTDSPHVFASEGKGEGQVRGRLSSTTDAPRVFNGPPLLLKMNSINMLFVCEFALGLECHCFFMHIFPHLQADC